MLWNALNVRKPTRHCETGVKFLLLYQLNGTALAHCCSREFEALATVGHVNVLKFGIFIEYVQELTCLPGH